MHVGVPSSPPTYRHKQRYRDIFLMSWSCFSSEGVWSEGHFYSIQAFSRFGVDQTRPVEGCHKGRIFMRLAKSQICFLMGSCTLLQKSRKFVACYPFMHRSQYKERFDNQAKWGAMLKHITRQLPAIGRHPTRLRRRANRVELRINMRKSRVCKPSCMDQLFEQGWRLGRIGWRTR